MSVSVTWCHSVTCVTWLMYKRQISHVQVQVHASFQNIRLRDTLVKWYLQSSAQNSVGMRQHVQKQTSVCQKGWQAKPRNQAGMSGIQRVPKVHSYMNSESKNGRVMKVKKWKQDDIQFYKKTIKLCALEKSAGMSVPIARYHVTYHVIPSHRWQKWKFCFTSRFDFRQVQLTSSIPRQLPIVTLTFKTLKDFEALKTKPTRWGTCLEGLPASWAQLRSHGWLHALWLNFPRFRER
jgi:hypothetical protein